MTTDHKKEPDYKAALDTLWYSDSTEADGEWLQTHHDAVESALRIASVISDRNPVSVLNKFNPDYACKLDCIATAILQEYLEIKRADTVQPPQEWMPIESAFGVKGNILIWGPSYTQVSMSFHEGDREDATHWSFPIKAPGVADSQLKECKHEVAYFPMDEDLKQFTCRCRYCDIPMMAWSQPCDPTSWNPTQPDK